MGEEGLQGYMRRALGTSLYAFSPLFLLLLFGLEGHALEGLGSFAFCLASGQVWVMSFTGMMGEVWMDGIGRGVHRCWGGEDGRQVFSCKGGREGTRGSGSGNGALGLFFFFARVGVCLLVLAESLVLLLSTWLLPVILWHWFMRNLRRKLSVCLLCLQGHASSCSLDVVPWCCIPAWPELHVRGAALSSNRQGVGLAPPPPQ